MLGTPLSRRWLAAIAACLLSLASLPAASQDAAPGEPAAEPQSEGTAKLDEARGVRRDANEEGQGSQKKIDALSDETETLFSRYSNTLKQIDSIRIYNGQMRDLIASQEEELASLQGQLDRVELVGRSVTPLMLRMIDALESAVALDRPFLIDERTERVEELRQLMARADVTNAEKYRRIMEAYQIENEFGRTIEAYRSTLEKDGKEQTVDFLRFGRIALLYSSLDGTEVGVWDNEARQWVELDASYRGAVRDGLKIARKQSAPDLIRLPLPAATKESN